MDPSDIGRFLAALGDVRTHIGGAEHGDPEVAWGDHFYFVVGRDGASPKMPFATVVTKDYPGWDEASRLGGDRFRVNVDVGRARLAELFGHAAGERTDAYDYAAENTLFPHPVYAAQGWASILRPAGSEAERLGALLVEAHARALGRVRRA